ncbi:MAG: hypothetical protein R3B07_35895 [Polyangiaceae bacterium]
MQTPSSRHPQALPHPQKLERLCQALATLDAVMSPEWDGRFYSFNAAWAGGQRMASMRDGSGDEFYIVFEAGRAFIKGLAHERSEAVERYSLEIAKAQVPEVFDECLEEPAFTPEYTSFVLWHTEDASGWSALDLGLHAHVEGQQGDPDGSADLLAILAGAPEQYVEFADWYFEVEVPLDAVRRVYAHEPLSEALVRELNPETSLDEIREDLEEIGYPLA